MAKEIKGNHKVINVASAFIVGAVTATVAGGYFLFGSKNAKKNRQKIEIWTLKAKAEVLEKIEGVKELGQEEYEKIVDTVTEKYTNIKEIGSEKVESLRKELKKHWKDIKIDAEKASKKLLKQ